ncbi:hypothetical protein ZIOFF_044333 [Zingiber officinale]|uniref:Suppressor of white apricot N-terminal domain-containing protein n=1 Tax=Zingiber officinale TaxID=94328 RepID=A0A8J5L071_ZINOF|nr:hypothetical protein ZIOFF_044333 [Zingiber officinale]
MWHEARRSERKVHGLMDAARKRAQRRAVYLAKRRGDSQQLLQVARTRRRVHRDDGLYQAAQDQQGRIPWNGKQDVLIDRFDGQALLDFIRDHSSRNNHFQQKTEEEEVEEFVNFERYRDLIKLQRRGFRKDTVAEMAKKRELERQRQEKLAEASRIRQYVGGAIVEATVEAGAQEDNIRDHGHILDLIPQGRGAEPSSAAFSC